MAKPVFCPDLSGNGEAGVPKGAVGASSFLLRDDLKAGTTHAVLWRVARGVPVGGP